MRRLIWTLLDWPLGLALLAATRIVERTSSLRVNVDFTGAPRIFVIWHRHLPLVELVCGRAKCWIMMSASPYMAPIARWSRLLGLRLVRGASGQGGRAALEELAEKTRAGESVLLAVDGPAGPAFRARPGCVDLALMTGAAIVPLASRGRGTFTVKQRWDRQLLARPFSQLEIIEGKEIAPKGTREELLARVQAALEALERTDANSVDATHG